MFEGILLFVTYFFQSIIGKILVPKPEKPFVSCLTKRLISNIKSLQQFSPLASGSTFHMLASALRPNHGFQYTKKEYLLNGEIVLDWVNPNSQKGIVVLFPGLGGSSHGIHMVCLTDELATRGFAVVVYNRRGHAKESILNLNFPEHANIEDTDMAIGAISRSGIPIYAIGISAGANNLVRYLGSKSNSPILAAVSICNVLDLNKSYERLRKSRFLDRLVTSWIKSIYERHYGPISNINTMKQFDEYVTGKPLNEYYDEQSSVAALEAIQIPILCISSRNDMIVEPCVCDIQDEIALKNPNVVSVNTIDGGHVGFMTKDGNWADKVAAEWIDARRRDLGKWPIEKA
jgi:predicted alpha/beta-fold hydrolase